MNVPRGTYRGGRDPVTKAGAWRVLPLDLPRPWRLALERDCRSAFVLRVPVTRGNSAVHPGTFRGLDLETGRARVPAAAHVVPELRARHTFLSGKARAVTVTPTYCRGDLCWVRAARTARARSGVTLELTAVGVSRLLDMTDEDAWQLGVAALPLAFRPASVPPRLWYLEYWDTQYGGRRWRRGGGWRANPWVWVLRFNVHHEQVDALLERWGGAK